MKEIKNLRKSNEKHFLNKDGTITAYLYDRDIHYLKNNQYVDIDNSIIDSGNGVSVLLNFGYTEDYDFLSFSIPIDIISNNYEWQFYYVPFYANSTGNLDSFREADGRKQEFKYDKNNQLTSMFNPKGNNFKFEYDNEIPNRI